MTPHIFTAGFLFCGLGAGALGFLEAAAKLGEYGAQFRSVGGIDCDKEACADFEYLTKSKATLADLSKMTIAELRAAWGEEAPDCIFLSPPCKGFSGLISPKKSLEQYYQDLNELVLKGLFLACETWTTPPSLIVIENVPRIQTKGAALLDRAKKLLSHYGYVFSAATHDCGEIGGLAQHRRRYLLVARLVKKVPCFIYEPPKQKVRGCGEVLGTLPLPEDPSAGPLHRLPDIKWLAWLRLALIPAGGDHRDLPSGPVSLEKTAQNSKSWNGRPGLLGVLDWNKPALTVTGSAAVSSSNAPVVVADPRLQTPLKKGQKRGTVWAKYKLRKWTEPTGPVTGPGSNGEYAVADPRLTCDQYSGAYGVLPWNEPASTVVGSASIHNSTSAVADPRKSHKGKKEIPIIVADDGTWHRPLTALEFAALQGLPAVVDGKPLQLAGKNGSRHQERIGNAVPVGAAKAIAESLLTALLAAVLGTWTLGSTGIWVEQQSINQLSTEGAL